MSLSYHTITTPRLTTAYLSAGTPGKPRLRERLTHRHACAHADACCCSTAMFLPLFSMSI